MLSSWLYQVFNFNNIGSYGLWYYVGDRRYYNQKSGILCGLYVVA